MGRQIHQHTFTKDEQDMMQLQKQHNYVLHHSFFTLLHLDLEHTYEKTTGLVHGCISPPLGE